MRRLLLFAFIFLIVPFRLISQVIPLENDTLNYRLIGFSFPAPKNENTFTLEIAACNCTVDSMFAKNIVKTVKATKNKIVTTVPAFGADYTWRVRPAGKAPKTLENKFYHFRVETDSVADTNKYRVTITTPAKKYKDAYFFMDGSRTLYDMDGNPLWFLPNKKNLIKGNSQVRDLKLSCKGTITMLVDSKALEVDYKGNVLWEGPVVHKDKSDTVKGYHHELTRLSNGNYMVLSFEPFMRPKPRPQPRDSAGHVMKRTVAEQVAPRHRYGNIVEYDPAGKQVWSWKSASYFENADLSRYVMSNGMQDPDVHENSFFFDEKKKVIYVSFRDIGQIIKIKYPSGEVLNVYGKIEGPEDSMQLHFFAGQHSVKLSKDGYLYLFNNRCTIKAIPTVVMMREPATSEGSLEKVWEFPCPVDTGMIPEQTRRNLRFGPRVLFSAGGNVMELPDRSLFVSTNATFNKMFIVTKDKKITWSADIEKFSRRKGEWEPMQQYRATIITDPHQIDELIWNSH